MLLEKVFELGKFQRLSQEKNIILIESINGSLLQVYVLEEDIIRFRYSTDGFFENDFSYAIDPQYIPSFPNYSLREGRSKISIITKQLIVDIAKKDLKVTILNSTKQIISEDEKGFHWEEDIQRNHIVKMSKKLQSQESFFGLGDKPSEFNLKRQSLQNWGYDAFGYTEKWDPLYKNIPFYYGLHNNLAYGIFFDNSFRTHFDFGAEKHTATTFKADGGEMNYYFIYGPALLNICKSYHQLTGKHNMPPKWALGYQQSRWSYFPESKVLKIAERMRKEKLPCDVIHIDIDYMDGYRCFTWDKNKFPGPKKMIKKLRDKGFKTVVIIDPGIKVDPDYEVFKEALENDYFCKRGDGKYMKGKVWPGDCFFPDFTNPKVREWWSGLYKELIGDLKVAGVWNDMNEPALFEVDNKTFPDDVRHDYDGNPCSHRKAHNVYGMQMVRATAAGLKKFNPKERTLAITRSGYAGLQRYSSVWTGDNISTWEHLQVAINQCTRLAICGVSFAGSDVGGFIENPDGELYVRWVQLAVFHSFFRTHSAKEYKEQNPWSFGKRYTDCVREALEFRYQLLPYLYTSFFENYNDGTPFLQPLSFIDQTNEYTYHREKEFLVGRHLLVSPVIQPKAKTTDVYLPLGEWMDFYTGDRMLSKHESRIKVNLKSIPLFVRAGALIPMGPVMQYVGEIKVKELTLRWYPGKEKCQSLWYEDDGISHDHKNGVCKKTTFTNEANKTSYLLKRSAKGKYNSSVKKFTIKVFGVTTPCSIEVDGAASKAKSTKGILYFQVSSEFKRIRITPK